MTQDWKASTKTTRYDKARVTQLRPIEAAIGRLRLPMEQSRKLRVLVSALEVQIETGGDSPEVNRLLLEALRAGVRHQVSEQQAQPVLRTIAVFEQAEARRWEQVRAGTLPAIVPSPDEQLGDLIQDGYTLLEQRQTAAACDRWLQAWELVKRLARPEHRTVYAFDAAHPPTFQSVFNWCQDLARELGNAGINDPAYYAHRLRYSREFLAQFPDADTDFVINFTRAEAEALWHLGRQAEAEAVGAALVERFPDEAWAYIGWADLHWLLWNSPRDYRRAEAILQPALARPTLKGRTYVLERLKSLGERREEEKEPRARTVPLPSPLPTQTRPAAQIAPPAGRRTGRNDPCWCGSGLKYKRCHLQADEQARRSL